MRSSHQYLLGYLAKCQGQEISYQTIKQKVRDLRKRKSNFNRKSSSESFQLDALVSELINFGLLKKERQQFIVKKPFLVQATLSVAKSGAGFAITNGISDIFIPNFKRNGGNSRDQVLVKITNKRRNRYEGEVVQLIKSFTKHFMAKILEERAKFYLVSLIDMPDQPLSALRKHPERKLQLGDYVGVHKENEMTSTTIPHGFGPRIQKIAYSSLSKKSPSNNISPALQRILLKYALPREYPKEGIPTKKSIKKKFDLGICDKTRHNLEKLYTCTIDGDDAKDFDDAISIEVKENITKIYVHIADVSYFVEKGAPCDLIALERGNSYYLKPSVLPMLPNILSEEYCSLKPKTKRLSVTCEMDFDKSFRLVESKFYRSRIYIKQRFTYSQAEENIKLSREPLNAFWKFAKQLRVLRLQKGGIALDLSDTEVIFDASGQPKDVRSTKQLQSHQLIEEFMLVANISAARFCKKNKIPAVHRVHEPMDKAKLESLNLLLGLLGSKRRLKDIEYSSLSKAFGSLEKKKDKEVFSYALLRSFMQANYEFDSRGHWGLGFQDYAHFTSPIRRYSDLILHRQMLAWQEKKDLPHIKADLKTIATHISQRERIALEAERNLFKLLTITLLENKIGEFFTARLIGFNQIGLFIMLNKFAVEGFIPVHSFDRTSQISNPSEYQVNITKYGKTIMLGEEFLVRYVRPDWDNMQAIFDIEKL